MQVDREKVISMLGAGVKPGQVASAVGCDVSYISQLLSDEIVAQRVAELRTADLVKYKKADDRYDEMESALQEKLNDLIPYFTKPRDVLNALQFLNNAKRRAATAVQQDIDAGEVVRLTLPSVTINNYKINMAGGMVEVEGRSLQPLSSATLLKTLEKQRGATNGDQKEVPRLASPNNGSNVPSELVVNEGKI